MQQFLDKPHCQIVGNNIFIKEDSIGLRFYSDIRYNLSDVPTKAKAVLAYGIYSLSIELSLPMAKIEVESNPTTTMSQTEAVSPTLAPLQ